MYVTEVNTWATEANALAGSIASLPTGAINDTQTNTTTTHSSQKNEDDYKITSGGAGQSTGMWVKFPDGTLIISGTKDTDINGDVSIGFPVAFVGGYTITATSTDNTNLLVFNFSKEKIQLLQTPLVCGREKQMVLPPTFGFYWQAIGRWK